VHALLVQHLWRQYYALQHVTNLLTNFLAWQPGPLGLKQGLWAGLEYPSPTSSFTTFRRWSSFGR